MGAEMKLVSSDQTKTTTKQVISMKGGLRTMPFIISKEAFEKVASYGLHAHMIMYLVFGYHLAAAIGASILFLWSATSNFTPISELFSPILSGLCYVLWLTEIFPQARPHHKYKCVPASTAQVMLFFASLGIMSVGSGGIKPCSLASGADQRDNPDNQKNERRLQSFFSWYYASVGASVMLAATVIVYIQVKLCWVEGFLSPCRAHVLIHCSLLIGILFSSSWDLPFMFKFLQTISLLDFFK